MLTCIECGTALKDMLEDEPPEYDAPRLEEPLLPEAEYTPVAGDVSSPTASRVMRLFRREGIPLKVEAYGYNMRLSVRSEDVPAAIALLATQGVLPEQADSGAAVAAEGGPCPACGAQVAPGSLECPDCGLQLGAEDEDEST
jgi:hypothetical protein